MTYYLWEDGSNIRGVIMLNMCIWNKWNVEIIHLTFTKHHIECIISPVCKMGKISTELQVTVTRTQN